MSARIASRAGVSRGERGDDHPGASPETLRALDEVRAKIELLSSVTESSLNRLTKSQLVGVVSDLLAMAARQEYDRARRFEAATASAEAKKARDKAERVAAARRAREKAEESRRRVERAAQTAAAITIQRHWRGHASRQRQNHHRRALIAYAEDAAAIEARVQATRRRDAAATKIQSEWRGRVARAEANRRWLEAWSERRDARNLERAAREDAVEMREREDREANAREEWRRMNAAGGDVKNALSALKSRRRSGRAPRPEPPPYRGDDDNILGFVVDAGEGGNREEKRGVEVDAPHPGEDDRSAARFRLDSDSDSYSEADEEETRAYRT
jgi:hypothetical protein